MKKNLERWGSALERRGMKVSWSKTKQMCVTERNPGGGEVRGGRDKESGGLGTRSTVQQWRLWKRGEKVCASRLERVEKSAWGDT